MNLSIHNQNLFNELKSLNLPSDQYVVFGSGLMGIRNLKKIGDIDIFVTPKFWNELLKSHQSKDGESIKLSDNVDAWRVWWPNPDKWDINKLISEAEDIDGIQFVPLKKVLEYKKNRGKEKDQKDAAIIDRYLKSADVA